LGNINQDNYNSNSDFKSAFTILHLEAGTSMVQGQQIVFLLLPFNHIVQRREI